MKTILKKRARVLAGVLAASLAYSSVSALSFSFSQGGFAEGATVSGSFTGNDDNGDGFLSYLPIEPILELTSFNLTFSGNSIVDTFTWGLSELEGFSFKLEGDSIIGNDFDLLASSRALSEGIAGFDGSNFLYIGEAFTFDPSITAFVLGPNGDDFSSSAAATKQVPDTGSSALLLGGAMLGLFSVRRKLFA